MSSFKKHKNFKNVQKFKECIPQAEIKLRMKRIAFLLLIFLVIDIKNKYKYS